MEFPEFLRWLSTSNGVAVAAGVVLSFLAERLPWYQRQSKTVKEWLFGAVTVSIPIAAAATRLALGYAGPYATPLAGFEQLFWPALVVGVTALVSGTAWHAKRYTRRVKRK